MARAEESLKRPHRAYLPLSLLTYVRLISLRVDAAARSDPTDFAGTVPSIVGHNVEARQHGRPGTDGSVCHSPYATVSIFMGFQLIL